MRTAESVRGTLDVRTMVKEYGLNACIGVNNIGNAFTPHGSCDALMLAFCGIGIYQAGTKQDAELLYECVSTRARTAIGLDSTQEADDRSPMSLSILRGDEASVVLFGGGEAVDWRSRKSISEVVYLYDGGRNRTTYLKGALTTALD